MSDAHRIDIKDLDRYASEAGLSLTVGSPWGQTSRQFDEQQIAQLRTRAAELEIRYLKAKDDVDSGRQAANEQAAFRAWASKVAAFDYRMAHALDATYLIWEMVREAQDIMAPSHLVNEYEEIKEQIAQLGQRLGSSDQA